MSNQRPFLDTATVPCSACGEAALDTGLECTECGHDMWPEVYPEDKRPESLPPPEAIQ